MIETILYFVAGFFCLGCYTLWNEIFIVRENDQSLNISLILMWPLFLAGTVIYYGCILFDNCIRYISNRFIDISRGIIRYIKNSK